MTVKGKQSIRPPDLCDFFFVCCSQSSTVGGILYEPFS